MITNAIDGVQKCDQLRHELSLLKYNPDLRKMLQNIENMVTDLSKKEVECRRTRNTRLLEQPLVQTNSAIDHLEKLILVAKIMD